MYGYYWPFISFYYFSFSLLLNIEIKTIYHPNLRFLYAFKYKNWNHQIQSYLEKNRNGNKTFIFIPHSHIPNRPELTGVIEGKC